MRLSVVSQVVIRSTVSQLATRSAEIRLFSFDHLDCMDLPLPGWSIDLQLFYHDNQGIHVGKMLQGHVGRVGPYIGINNGTSWVN